jgi:alanine-glyoxylate transaminase/serine-glyoxylate transaminase/serine-pyruvate transaminase
MMPQNNDQNLQSNGTINHNNNNNGPSPIAIPSIKLFGAGPTSLNPSVVEVLKTPILSPLNPAFIEVKLKWEIACSNKLNSFKVLNDVKAGLRHLFQTSNPFTFAISGTGHAGLECALLNLLERGEKILVVENGRWGQCVRQMTEERHGLEMAILAEKWGKAVELKAFKRVSKMLYFK